MRWRRGKGMMNKIHTKPNPEKNLEENSFFCEVFFNISINQSSELVKWDLFGFKLWKAQMFVNFCAKQTQY